MENVLARDKKKVKTGGIPSVLSFGFAALVRLPLMLFVALPIGFTLNLLMWPFSIFSGKSKGNSEETDPTKYELPEIDAEKQIPLESRQYDLVLYGCTGFTGRLAASYLAKNYGNSIKWAIAGRRKSRLEEVRKELIAETDSEELQIDIIVADSGNEDTLHDLVNNTRVVISTVGPFTYYGTPIVKFCVAYGTSYADVTGETNWVREMIVNFQKDATRTGARIVSLCGNDCLPWDLLGKLLADELKSNSETEVAAFEFYNDIAGGISGGTFATLLASLTSKAKKIDGGDPLHMLNSGSYSENRIKWSKEKTKGYSKRTKKWHTNSPLAAVNIRCVQRSNALLDYGKKVTYFEATNSPNWFTVHQNTIDTMQIGIVLLITPFRKLALALGLMPRPGQGPSMETMMNGYLRVHGFAVGTDGSVAEGAIYFPQDPGYSSTARMLVESGLSMALQGDELQGGGGFYSPAAGLGNVVRDRLEKSGTEFEILTAKK